MKHRTDALLTAITLGAWGFVWFAKAIEHWRKPWRCRTCTRPREENKKRPRATAQPPPESPVAMPMSKHNDAPSLARQPRQQPHGPSS